MSNSKITLDDVLALVERMNGGVAEARVTLTSVSIVSNFGHVLVAQAKRDSGDDAAITAARSILASAVPNYIVAREKTLRDAEERAARVRSELDVECALVASLRAAVEAAK